MPADSSRSRTALVRKAIRHAAITSPDDDAGFVRAMREYLYSEGDVAAELGEAIGRMARTVARPARATLPAERTPIYRDTRFLENARKLARDTDSGTRILGGSTVRGREFDDCVAVGDDEQFCCTGTLIAPKVVLTAGHCTDRMTRVFVGNDIDRRGREYRVERAVRHQDYAVRRQPKEIVNDLLVLHLEEPIRGVTPRKFASTRAIDGASYARAVGFGSNESMGRMGYGIKRQVDIPIVSHECKGRVEGRTDREAYGCRVRFEMVAAKNLSERDTCRGDSGGPLYVANARGTWQLAAVTSRATLNATSICGDGGIYVRVDRYLAWIEKVTKIAPRRR